MGDIYQTLKGIDTGEQIHCVFRRGGRFDGKRHP